MNSEIKTNLTSKIITYPKPTQDFKIPIQTLKYTETQDLLLSYIQEWI